MRCIERWRLPTALPSHLERLIRPSSILRFAIYVEYFALRIGKPAEARIRFTDDLRVHRYKPISW